MTRALFELRDKPQYIKEKCLSQAESQAFFTLLDSNNNLDKYGKYKWICAWGNAKSIAASAQSFKALRAFHQQHKDWCFGHLNFNLKNELENLKTKSIDNFGYENLSFFIPEHVVYATAEGVFCESLLFGSAHELLQHLNQKGNLSVVSDGPKFKLNTSRESYLQKIERLKSELQYGNIYEINFCIEFTGQESIQPVSYFKTLNNIHRAPFTAFYKNHNNYLLCFSPERYLKKTGARLISQPIKGTAARDQNKHRDDQIKANLLASEKERAENVMIVDLVRNDLSRTAKPGSVKVPELFQIYSYPAVHQMTSTIESEMAPNFDFVDALATSFPMGSMTGAPKISALKLIDEHENFNRSLYSGSVGYISPEGDFDFNVVIRSILYNTETKRSSVRVGSAITIHCDAAQEFEECLLKAEKLIR